MGSYELTREVWEIDAGTPAPDGPIEEVARHLLRYAILAPSSHNSQPWRFVVDGASIAVHPAEERWLEVADRDRRELYLSLGCAVENLRVAAEGVGVDYRLDYPGDAGSDGADGEGAADGRGDADDSEGDDGPAAVVTLRPDGDPSRGRPTDLFDAITERRTTHGPFSDRPLSRSTRDRIGERVVKDDVGVHLIDDAERKGEVAELQADADRAQMADPAYREELGYWVGTGALGASWLAARIGQTVVTHLDLGDREARKNSKLIRSAPVVAVLTTPADDPTARLRAGQAFERVALTATAEGVATHPMSQILERLDARADLADLLDGDGRPQHLFRLGYTDGEEEHTPRWPLEKFVDWSD